MTSVPKPIVLLILDGWGHNDSPEDNAIFAAKTPVWDHLWTNSPHQLIQTSGESVGLPDGQMGNSEVGHMNLGAGRVVYQDFTRISRAIEQGTFKQNPVLVKAIDTVKSTQNALHIFGLLSSGGVHSHEVHIQALCQMAAERGLTKIYLHAFLDGRDTAPKSAQASIDAMNTCFSQLGCGKIISVIGRYYAMDRDQRWDRVQAAYDLITSGKAAHHVESAMAAVEAAYARGETDEFVQATSVHVKTEKPILLEDNDAVIFMNFRSDRARQLTRAFVYPDFDGFVRERTPKLADFVTLTAYAADIQANCAFPAQEIHNGMADYLSQLGKTQLRLAETEKYAHVTFFFSSGKEALVPGEKRILIPSPKVATYDLQPEMSANDVTDALVDAIASQEFDFIVCNYANADMVGHSGNFQAAIQAVEAIDQSLKRIIAALEQVEGECLITADHGNIECMRNPDNNQPHTAHTTKPVPFVYVGHRDVMLTGHAGSLCDVAPTLLNLMNLTQPEEMTGRPLLTLRS